MSKEELEATRGVGDQQFEAATWLGSQDYPTVIG